MMDQETTSVSLNKGGTRQRGLWEKEWGGAGTHDTSQRAGATRPVPARCPLAWLRMEQRTPG